MLKQHSTVAVKQWLLLKKNQSVSHYYTMALTHFLKRQETDL